MATITIRLKDTVRDQLVEAADERGVALSEYIRDVLETQMTLEAAGDVGIDRPEPSDDIDLTPFQRKVLQLLHRNTLAAHGDLSEQHYDPKHEVQMIKTLENGYTSDYRQEFTDISAPLSKAECEFVWDLLDMFRMLQNSVRAFGEDGWGAVGIENAERYGTFQGFDFNEDEEIRLALYARHLVKNGRWTEQEDAFAPANDGGNSHSRMLPRYKAMLRVFKPIWRRVIDRGRSYRLTPEEVRAVVSATPDPRSRI